jgi:transcriptional regulator with XRE-family HTH domain
VQAVIDPLAELRRRLRGKSQRVLARELGVSVGYLNDVLTGDKSPGPLLLAGLGLERESRTTVVYRRA